MKNCKRNAESMPVIQKYKYINTKDNLVSSIVDNTPKVGKFNLFKNTPSSIKLAQINSSSVSAESCPISNRKEANHERLKHRMLERELLKSNQRVQNDTVSLLSLDPSICHEKVLYKSITYKNPSKSLHSKQAVFENYDNLPENKLKLIFNSRILKNDKGNRYLAAMDVITRNIEREMQVQYQREDTLKIKREEQRKKMQERIELNTNIEVQAGVTRSKSVNSVPAQVTDRLKNLSQPKTRKKDYMQAIDFKGLLNRDYYEAIESYKGSKFSLSSSKNTSSRYKKEPFQFPDNLITRQGCYIHERQLVNRPSTTSFFTRVKKHVEPLKDLEEENAIKESLVELNKFDFIFRNYKSRQGFPSIQLSEQLFS